MEVLEFLFVGWGVCALFGYLVGRTRNRGGEGAFWALMFGPLGVLIVALKPPAEPDEKCRWCNRGVVKDKKRCACGHRYDDNTPRQVADPIDAWERQQGE
jgi:hypothetical protein